MTPEGQTPKEHSGLDETGVGSRDPGARNLGDGVESESSTLSMSETTLPAQGHETSTGLIRVDPLPEHSRGREVLNFLQAEKDTSFFNEAQKLAAQTTLEDVSPILAYSKDAREKVKIIADQGLEGRNVGELDALGNLFSEIEGIAEQLDISKVTRPKGGLVRFLTSLPKVGKHFEPIIRFFERYKRLKPLIDGKKEEIANLEVQRTEAKHRVIAMQKAIINSIRPVQVSIAASAIVLDRESQRFARDLENLKSSGNTDMVAWNGLHERSMAWLNLDNRLQKLINVVTRSNMDIPAINLQIANDTKIISTLEDLREVTITQLAKQVFLALNVVDSRRASKFGRDVADLTRNMESAYLETLGMAQEEGHELATQSAREVEHLVACMTKVSSLVKRGAELLVENKRLNAQSTARLQAEGAKYKDEIQEAFDSFLEAA